MYRYFMEISYRGTAYHGWQVQPDASSIQGLITHALSVLMRREIALTGAGRTDAGVHARQTFAHFDLPEPVASLPDLVYRLNAFLPGDILIKDIFPVRENAHARYDAVSRSYEYRVYLGKNPFGTGLEWQWRGAEPDTGRMNAAAALLPGYSDFKAFSRSHTDVKTYICKLTDSRWVREGNRLTYYVTADRFLRNMVRAITGTLWDTGLGKIDLERFKAIVESRDRRLAGPSAPAAGLYLSRVEYDWNKIRLPAGN